MKKLNSSLVLGAALTALTGQAAAELRVVVTPTKTEKPISEVNPQVEVITREDIERINPSSVVELLNAHAGIEIVRSGGFGQSTSTFIRGGESRHTLVLVNGKPISPDAGQANLGFINPELIERVEVLKGPRSSLYGSQAIGGVINITTKKASEGFSGELSTKAGNYDSGEVAGSINYGADNMRINVGVVGQESTGPSAQATPIDKDEFKNTAAVVGAEFDVANTTIYLDSYFQEADVDYDTSFGPDGRHRTKNQASTVGARTQLTEQLNVDVSYSQNLNVRQEKPASLNNVSEIQRDIAKAELKAVLSEQHIVIAGVEFEDETYKASSANLDVDSDHKSAFVQHEMDYGKHDLVLGLRVIDHDNFNSHTTGNAEYSYQVNEGLNLFGGVATGFKAPSNVNRFRDFPSPNPLFSFYANPDLKPEESITREFGLRTAKDNHAFKVSLFNTDVDNLITSVARVGGGQTLGNVAQANIDGIELGYDYQTEELTAYFELINQSAENAQTGDDLLRRADTQIKMGFTYKPGKVSYSGQLIRVSSRADKDFSSFPSSDITLKAYTLANISVAYDVTSQIELSASAENIGNVSYQNAFGFDAPKATYFGRVRYKF